MKVAVIGFYGFYGSLTEWVANSWEELGHEVTRVDRKEVHNLEKKMDIYFFVDCSEDYSLSIPNDLNGVKIFWAMDVQMPGGTERAVNIARKVDYTFCSNYEFGVKILEKFGIESTWMPYGYDRAMSEKIVSLSQVINEDDDYDVNLIGNPNSQLRVELWGELQKRYKAVTGRIESKDRFLDAMATTKIVVNQPTEPWNNIINLRVWDATACGKFLLCKRTSIKEMDVLGFIDGINVVYWDTFEDLFEKIDYYLEHEEEREIIAQGGFKLGQRHLMPNQVRNIEQIILSKFYERFI